MVPTTDIATTHFARRAAPVRATLFDGFYPAIENFLHESLKSNGLVPGRRAQRAPIAIGSNPGSIAKRLPAFRTGGACG